MNINGMETKVDVIQSVIDNIDNNDLATAKDSLELLKEVEEGFVADASTNVGDTVDDVNNPDFEHYAGRYGKSVKEWKEEALNPNGKYVLVENSKEPEDSKVDTMIQLENEAKQGK